MAYLYNYALIMLQDAAKRSRSKRDGRLYQLRHDKVTMGAKVNRKRKFIEAIEKAKRLRQKLERRHLEEQRMEIEQPR